ncbi:plant/protein [Rhynchospora pubera]|uniref:Plant/protein n=1 Tax=Rhynchospora pubera TaxID=906938 RepID=A0AAV8FSG9_9POAL|nr:plant/protein [Rhynchospora pubera]KAJ4767555.1 plant/protein [Rhynchospora pubera]KAJ4796459.1 plant/protein [Rhynchospora pubera]
MATTLSPAPIKLPTARSAAKPSSFLSLVRTNHRLLSKLSSSPVFLDLRSHGGSRSVPSTSVSCLPSSSGGRGEANEEGEDVERALGMDGSIPGSSQEFVRRVSSRAYEMRRNLIQSIDSLGYDVLEKNPWREDTKPVYVLTQRDNHLWTMKTRRSRSEVERELGMLFSKGGNKKGLGVGTKTRTSGVGFNMLVEDIREGVLVFEDENDAAKYCDILQGGGQGCEGIAELEASSVFDICHKMKALAVLFRKGRSPPLPTSLERNLKARKRSLED